MYFSRSNRFNTFSLVFAFVTFINILISNRCIAQKGLPIALSIETYEASLEKAIQRKDTLSIIDTRIKLIQRYSRNWEYNKAYDEIWTTLPLLNSIAYLDKKIQVYNKLVGLYLLFDQHEKAVSCYQELSKLVLHKSLKSKDRIRYQARISGIGAWIELEKGTNYAKAERMCLESILQYQELPTNTGYLTHARIQLLHIYIKSEQQLKAYELLQ